MLEYLSMDFKKTKIVATIGPASTSPQILKGLIKSGLDVARLNFSHGTHQERREQIQNIRAISKELGKPVAIMADMQGPKLRLGLVDGKKEIKKGEIVSFSSAPTEGEIPMQFDLSPYMSKGERMFVSDGSLEFKIVGVDKKTIKAQAQNNGVISSNKGVNVPDTIIKNTAFTPKDQKDLEFVLGEGVDFVALSFVQSAEDIKPVKEIIKKFKSNTQIVSKIEKRLAVENLEEIMKESDVVMVARGDLGIEIKASQVPIIQHKIIVLARQFQKSVIVATQMLESMIENPRPTRAETSDVANAVLSEVDAVMLSAETASGKYPLEAVKTMNEIILSVEENPEYNNLIQINWRNIAEEQLSISAIVSEATALANRIKAKTIVVATSSGSTAKILASFRPNARIIATSYDPKIQAQLQMVWGVECLLVKATNSYNSFWKQIIGSIIKKKVVNKGDKVVIVSGSLVGVSGQTDTIKVVTI